MAMQNSFVYTPGVVANLTGVYFPVVRRGSEVEGKEPTKCRRLVNVVKARPNNSRINPIPKSSFVRKYLSAIGCLTSVRERERKVAISIRTRDIILNECVPVCRVAQVYPFIPRVSL